MRVQWRQSAVNDLANIRDFIAENDPSAALSVVTRILQAVGRLEDFPKYGRPGLVSGTREIVVPGLPYIVIYLPQDGRIEVVAVFHAARSRR